MSAPAITATLANRRCEAVGCAWNSKPQCGKTITTSAPALRAAAIEVRNSGVPIGALPARLTRAWVLGFTWSTATMPTVMPPTFVSHGRCASARFAPAPPLPMPAAVTAAIVSGMRETPPSPMWLFASERKSIPASFSTRSSAGFPVKVVPELCCRHFFGVGDSRFAIERSASWKSERISPLTPPPRT